MSQLVLTEVAGPLAVLTLNRPERHNSLVPEFLAGINAALAKLASQPDIRALVLQANGRSFSTGGDVRAFYEQGDGIGAYAAGLVQQLNDVVLSLLQFPAPVICAVNGIVTGGSIGFVLASDIVLLAPEASFTPYYSVVGFSPDGGWTALLPQVIGARRTADVLLQNLTISAGEAVTSGLASRVVAAADLRAEAMRVAQRVAGMRPGSVKRARRLLLAGGGDVAARLHAEHRQFCEQVVTAEAREGMAAFLGR